MYVHTGVLYRPVSSQSYQITLIPSQIPLKLPINSEHNSNPRICKSLQSLLLLPFPLLVSLPSLHLSQNGLALALHTCEAYPASGLSSLMHTGLCSNVREIVHSTWAKNNCPSLTLSCSIWPYLIFIHSNSVYSFVYYLTVSPNTGRGDDAIYLLTVCSS